nr:MAG TPA: hypothetical protein [Bacteriophage sp.]DAV38681.1 MAG TPA: hypothetical protein [Caudoviricetes sp.]
MLKKQWFPSLVKSWGKLVYLKLNMPNVFYQCFPKEGGK